MASGYGSLRHKAPNAHREFFTLQHNDNSFPLLKAKAVSFQNDFASL
jgi:hypothetical protein